MDGAFLLIEPGPLKRQPLHATEPGEQQEPDGADSFGMFTICLGLAERLAQPADFLAAEVAHAPRAGHAADALGGVPFDLAEADRVLEDRVKRRHRA